MKKIGFLMPIAILMAIVSCKKDSANNGGGNPGLLVRIQQGVSADDDTVYLIKYDDKKRISMLVDSIYGDTLTAFYNTDGFIDHITEHSDWSNDGLSVLYDNSGHPTTITFSLFGEHKKFELEYSGDMPSKNAYYTDGGQGGSLKLRARYEYVTSGGNITNIKEYDAADGLKGECKITYGTQKNPFKTLALLNWSNRLGMSSLAPIEALFNANIPAKTEWVIGSGLDHTETVTVKTNSAGDVTGAIAKDVYPSGVLDEKYCTWGFSYK